MICNFDPVGECIKRCPFLNALVMTEGESFARKVATDFSKAPVHDFDEATKPSSNVQEIQDVSQSFTLAHSPQGLLPLPAASLSLSGFWPDFNPFNLNGKQNRKPQKKKKPSSSSSGSGSSSSVHSMSSPSTGGQCPMRKIFGPLASALMSKRYQCPKPVVMMRAALAKTPVVKALRPESLEIKLLAIALASSALNVPFGMLREHTRKFSPEWFLVVHATIPFIAMFRKAVVMPPYAILFTIASAIGGQAIGAKAEQRRLQWTQKVDLNPAFIPEKEDQNHQIKDNAIVV